MLLQTDVAKWVDHVEDELPTTGKEIKIRKMQLEETEQECKLAKLIVLKVLEHNRVTPEDIEVPLKHAPSF